MVLHLVGLKALLVNIRLGWKGLSLDCHGHLQITDVKSSKTLGPGEDDLKKISAWPSLIDVIDILENY